MAAAWELQEQFLSAPWIIESTFDGSYTLKSAKNQRYLSSRIGRNGSQLDASFDPHPWRVRPGSKPDSFMFESVRYPRMFMDLNFGSPNPATKVQLWSTGQERPPQRSWYVKLAPGFPDVTTGSRNGKNDDEDAEKRKTELLEREVRLKALEDAVGEREAAAKEKEGLMTQQAEELKQREINLAKLDEAFRGATAGRENNNENEVRLKAQDEKHREQEAAIKRMQENVAQQEEELKLRALNLAKQEEAFEESILSSQNGDLAATGNIAPADDGDKLNTREDMGADDPFVHSRTAFDLTETGPKAKPGWVNFMHLKRL